MCLEWNVKHVNISKKSGHYLHTSTYVQVSRVDYKLQEYEKFERFVYIWKIMYE